MTSRLYAVHAVDRAGLADARAAARDAHRHFLRAPHASGVRVVLGGPLLNEAGAMNGTLLVVQAGSIDAVRRFVADDPYTAQDLFASVDVREWRCGLVRADLLPASASLPDANTA